uniref:Uncharacterized protein n=1 Tax=Vertebrata thuyoides TaxID=2006970 RepID=A0A1Z1MAI6_9FLOR|nr:hypothetical protein [Vertebrata thuyoides]ARW63097.1 hypothetical protein [Vertebrata thuyoides]
MFNYQIILSLLPFTILIILPYYSYISFFTLTIIIIINQHVNIYTFKIIKYLQKISLFFSYFIINTFFIDNSYYNKLKLSKQVFYLIYSLKIKIIKKNIYTIYFYHFNLHIPNYLKKIFFIHLVHVTTTNNLFIFIKNTGFFKIILHNLNKKSILKNNQQELILFTIFLNYQILEKSINNFQHIYLGIKTKQHLSRYYFLIYMSNHSNNFLNKFINNKYLLMLTIWNRF